MRTCLFILSLFIASAIQGQHVLNAKVIAASSGRPVAGASVYIDNSSIGALTNAEGLVELRLPSLQKIDLVVSSIGFTTFHKTIDISQVSILQEISLQEKIVDLQEVSVGGYTLEGWNVWGDFFKRIVFGNAPFANQCKILNTNQIHFRNYKTSDKVIAFADEPILIRNNALGYLIKYDLVVFEATHSGSSFSYAGHPFFTELKPDGDKQMQTWQRNREMAFLGSVNHFFRSLYRNTLAENGFIIKSAPNTVVLGTSSRNVFARIPKTLTADSIAFAVDSMTVAMSFSGQLMVKLDPQMMFDRHPDLKRHNPFLSEELISMLNLKTDQAVIVLYNGSYYDVLNLQQSGYWLWRESIATLLPLGFYVKS
jgi:hypothetical protein